MSYFRCDHYSCDWRTAPVEIFTHKVELASKTSHFVKPTPLHSNPDFSVRDRQIRCYLLYSKRGNCSELLVAGIVLRAEFHLHVGSYYLGDNIIEIY